MINIGGPAHFMWVVFSATVACMIFACATQGWMVVQSRWYESVLLGIATLVLLRPDLIRDRFYPPFELQPPVKIASVLNTIRPGENIRLRVEVDNKNGKVQERTFLLPMAKGIKPEQGIASAGVVMEERDGKTLITDVVFDSPATACSASRQSCRRPTRSGSPRPAGC
jgi:hypothetical protein